MVFRDEHGRLLGVGEREEIGELEKWKFGKRGRELRHNGRSEEKREGQGGRERSRRG